jgi:hypothetical protein
LLFKTVIYEKICKKSWQFQLRIGLRVTELAVGSWQMMESSAFS